MLIILEGPDCGGKTTLAEELRAHLDAWYLPPVMLKKGPPRLHPLDEYVAPLIGYRPHRGMHIIADRWHVGERVYPAVLGRRTQLTDGMMRYVELFLQSRGAITIPVMPSLSVLLERHGHRGDDLINEAILPEVRERFVDELARLKTLRVPAVLDEDHIVDLARRREARAAYVARLTPSGRFFETLIGDPQPNVLLMGDVRNCQGGDRCAHRIHHPANGPAFMPYPQTSGDYLLSSLDPLPDDVALANACDVDDARLMWETIDRPFVVALGQRAHLELERVRVPHATVPHPQYVRRFHHHVGRQQYGELIHAVIGTERNEMKWRPSPRPRVETLTPAS